LYSIFAEINCASLAAAAFADLFGSIACATPVFDTCKVISNKKAATTSRIFRKDIFFSIITLFRPYYTGAGCFNKGSISELLRNISQQEAETGHCEQALPGDDGGVDHTPSGCKRIGNGIIAKQEMHGQGQQGQNKDVQYKGVRFHGRVGLEIKLKKAPL
jgi:hypothetical protein